MNNVHEYQEMVKTNWPIGNCTYCVPNMLTEDHNQNRLTMARVFLSLYEEQGNDFLDCIVTGNETCISHHTPENKQQLCNGNAYTHQINEKIQTFNILQFRHQFKKSWQPFSWIERDFSLNFCLEDILPMLALPVRHWKSCPALLKTNSKECWCGESAYCTTMPICTLLVVDSNYCSPLGEKFWCVHRTVQISQQVTFTCFLRWRNI